MDWDLIIDQALSLEPTQRAIALLKAMSALEVAMKAKWRREERPEATPFKDQVASLFQSSAVDPSILSKAWVARSSLLHESELPSYVSLRETLPTIAHAWALLLEDPAARREFLADTAPEDLAALVDGRLPPFRLEASEQALAAKPIEFGKVAALLPAFREHENEEVVALGVCLASAWYEYELYSCLRRLGGFDLTRARIELEDEAAAMGLFVADDDWSRTKTTRNRVAHRWWWKARSDLDQAVSRLADTALALKHDRITARRVRIQEARARFLRNLEDLRSAVAGLHTTLPLSDRLLAVMREAAVKSPLHGDDVLLQLLAVCTSAQANIDILTDDKINWVDLIMPGLIETVQLASVELHWQHAKTNTENSVHGFCCEIQRLDVTIIRGQPNGLDRFARGVVLVLASLIVGFGSCVHGACWGSDEAATGLRLQKGLTQFLAFGLMALVALVVLVALHECISRAREVQQDWVEQNVIGMDRIREIRQRARASVDSLVARHPERAATVAQTLRKEIANATGKYTPKPGMAERSARYWWRATALLVVALGAGGAVSQWRPWELGEAWWPTEPQPDQTTPVPPSSTIEVLTDRPATSDLARFGGFGPYEIRSDGDVFCGWRANLGSGINSGGEWRTLFDAVNKAYSPTFSSYDAAIVAYWDGSKRTLGVVFADRASLTSVPKTGLPVKVRAGRVLTIAPNVIERRVCFGFGSDK